jgi:hypothetical protein
MTRETGWLAGTLRKRAAYDTTPGFSASSPRSDFPIPFALSHRDRRVFPEACSSRSASISAAAARGRIFDETSVPPKLKGEKQVFKHLCNALQQ